MLDINLKQLEIFEAVAERSSFTRAAEELYLTQSTVSAHISNLEEALGKPLFVRDCRRNVQLTPEGQRLYPAVKRILRSCHELKSVANAGLSGLPLNLGASTVPAQFLLPEILSAYLRKHPDCRYLLERGDSAEIHAGIRTGRIRIGFVGTRLDAEALHYDAIATDRMVLVTQNNASYRAQKKLGIWGWELLQEPTVAREEGSGTDRTIEEYKRARGMTDDGRHIVARIDNPETIKRMVENGAGVSVLSALAVKDEVRSGRLLSFEIDEKGLKRQIYMISRKKEKYEENELAFMRFVEKFAAAVCIVG